MSQKKIFPQKYYTDLVEYCYKSYISDAAMTLLLLRLAGSDYEITAVDAKYVFKMMLKSAHNAVFYFLMVEEKLTKEERTSFLQELNKKYRDSQPTGNKSLISKLQYLYLKKQYPSETAELNIRQFSSDTITFRLRSKETIVDNVVARAISRGRPI
jgi:AAA15 family ATPase/GTPase